MTATHRTICGGRSLAEKRKLDDREISERLKQLQGWSVEGGKLFRSISFRSFEDAFAFMTRCALEIEKLDHHPDWFNVYRKVRIDLSTHEAGGITDLDFELASRMNDILQGYRVE